MAASDKETPLVPKRWAFLVVCGLLAVLVALAAVASVACRSDALATTVNVRDYGARGNGRADDTRAFDRAMAAATRMGHTLFVPAGVYPVDDLALPDGLTMDGAGWQSSWLKGPVTFGSNGRVSDLKIGKRGVAAVHNRKGAGNTRFTRCRFRGGGGSAWTYVVDLGSGEPCRDITFRSCLIERNQGKDPDGNRGFNNVTIWVGRGAPVTDITFEKCRFGVSNGKRGRSSGAPRMGLECFVERGAVAAWRNITLRGCVFEATDGHSADFSDQPSARGTGLLIEGCTFKGGGLGGNWGWTLALEMPLDPVIRNNRFYRGRGHWGYVLAVVDRGDAAYTRSGASITDNLFDLDADNGIARVADGWPIVLNNHDNRFTGNTIRYHYGTRHAMVLDHAYRTAIIDNRVLTGGRPIAMQINGSSGNTLTPNSMD